MLEQKLKDLGEKNLEVSLLYKGTINGIVALVTWHDPKHCYTLRTERIIQFSDLHKPPISCNIDSTFEFNLSNILGNMATKVLKKAERYTHLKGENYETR